MWTYERKLEYPVNIKTTSADMALAIMSQYGGLYCNCTLLSVNRCTGAISLLFTKPFQ